MGRTEDRENRQSVLPGFPTSPRTSVLVDRSSVLTDVAKTPEATDHPRNSDIYDTMTSVVRDARTRTTSRVVRMDGNRGLGRWSGVVVSALAMVPALALLATAVFDQGPGGGVRLGVFPVALVALDDFTWVCA